MLVRAGLLPGGRGARPTTLARNASARFEARWVRLLPRSGVTPFLDDDEPIELPVAHGEGRFLTADPTRVEALDRDGRIVLKYAGPDDRPTVAYPDNPNGSSCAAAGVCDASGRVFGLMPHPERFVDPFHHPRWTRNGPKAGGDGLRIFRNAVRAGVSAMERSTADDAVRDPPNLPESLRPASSRSTLSQALRPDRRGPSPVGLRAASWSWPITSARPIDRLPEPGGLVMADDLVLNIGGCAANAAMVLAKLGRAARPCAGGWATTCSAGSWPRRLAAHGIDCARPGRRREVRHEPDA